MLEGYAAAPHPVGSERARYIDAARAIMLLLGIPFHISEVYRVSGGFVVDSPDHSYLASLLSGLIHSFRLPAFFLLSGYFAGVMMDRQGPRPWLRGRFVRLGVPLVLTAVSLGVVEQALINHFGKGMGWAKALTASLSYPADWIQHRWFLAILLMFCLTLAAIAPQRPRLIRFWSRLVESRHGIALAVSGFWVLLLVTPFAAIAMGKLLGDWLTHSELVKEYTLYYSRNLIYFLAGYAIFVMPGGLERFTRIGMGATICALIALGLYLCTYFAFYPAEHELPDLVRAIGIAAEGITGFLVARLFFSWMRQSLDRDSRVVDYLVDGAICIYLVHGVFFLAFAGLFLQAPFNPIAEMAVINVLTVAGCLLVFEIARRVPALAWPLNGRPFKFATGWTRPKSPANSLASQES